MPFAPMVSLLSWWKRDTARNTFVYTNFLINLPFTVFNTYVIFQLQLTGFLLGTDADGLPCTEYCLVPFGNGVQDLNSAILYMNAMTFGFGGVIMIFLIAYADFWSTFTLVCLGLPAVPCPLRLPKKLTMPYREQEPSDNLFHCRLWCRRGPRLLAPRILVVQLLFLRGSLRHFWCLNFHSHRAA
jgi:hypothetical protein